MGAIGRLGAAAAEVSRIATVQLSRAWRSVRIMLIGIARHVGERAATTGRRHDLHSDGPSFHTLVDNRLVPRLVPDGPHVTAPARRSFFLAGGCLAMLGSLRE